MLLPVYRENDRMSHLFPVVILLLVYYYQQHAFFLSFLQMYSFTYFLMVYLEMLGSHTQCGNAADAHHTSTGL